MDLTECPLDDQGEPRCGLCGGTPIESSRHPSHTDFRTGAPVAIDRVWGDCPTCNASGWWRAEHARVHAGR